MKKKCIITITEMADGGAEIEFDFKPGVTAIEGTAVGTAATIMLKAIAKAKRKHTSTKKQAG